MTTQSASSSSSRMGIRVEPLAKIGARVDLDLSAPLTAEDSAALVDLLTRHRLLYFPNQNLRWEDQARVMRAFGPVVEEEASLLSAGNSPAGLGDAELAFHCDLSSTPQPLRAISLLALAVDEGAPPTRFVDAARAAAELSEAQRHFLRGLHVRNLWPLSLSERQRSAAVPSDWPGAEHLVLKPHPVSGIPIIFANASHSDRIVELEADESERVISELFAHLYQPDRIYEHRWKVGDLLVWDNLALQHARPVSRPGTIRTLQRVTVGTSGYMDQMPVHVAAAYGLTST